MTGTRTARERDQRIDAIAESMRAEILDDLDRAERARATRYRRERDLPGILRGHFPEVVAVPPPADIVPMLEQVTARFRQWGRDRHRAYSFAQHFNARCALMAEKSMAIGDAP